MTSNTSQVPDFAIIVAQKSASTFVQHVLQSHPEIFIPGGEIAVFEEPQYSDFDFDAFLSLFKPGRDVPAIGLKRPNYLHEPDVPARLANHLPDLRLIAILRDPVCRAISAYYHCVRQGFAPAVDINKGLPAILDGRWKNQYPLTAQIVDYGKYGTQVQRYAEYFGRDQLFLTTHRSVKESPLDVAQSICQFVGLDTSPKAFTLPSGKSNAGTYSMTRLRWLRLKNSIRFEYFYDAQRLRPRTNVSPLGRMALRVIDKVDREVLQPMTENNPPQLQPKVRARLINAYREDVEILSTDYDLDIRHWSLFSEETH
jgi:hypothetical protein